MSILVIVGQNFIKGILIGISFLIPGVSGGTMMLILGVFEDAIKTINSLMQGKFYKVKQLFWIAVGTIVGILLCSPIILHLLLNYRIYVIYFFLGIVLYGLQELASQTKIKAIKIKDLLYLLLGMVIIVGINLLDLDHDTSGIQDTNFWNLILMGIPLSIALILPGISSSYLLLVFGIYDEVLMAIESINLSILIPLILGINIGTLLFTHLLERLLIKNRRYTYLVIIGFVLASMIQILITTPLPSIGWDYFILVSLIGIGYVLMKYFTKMIN